MMWKCTCPDENKHFIKFSSGLYVAKKYLCNAGFFNALSRPWTQVDPLWALPFLLAIQLFQWSICGSVRRGERPWSALEDTQGCQGQYEDMPKTSLWYMVNINCWRWGGKPAWPVKCGMFRDLTCWWEYFKVLIYDLFFTFQLRVPRK